MLEVQGKVQVINLSTPSTPCVLVFMQISLVMLQTPDYKFQVESVLLYFL